MVKSLTLSEAQRLDLQNDRNILSPITWGSFENYMAFRARQSKGVSWAAAAKTEATDVCQRCSPGDTGTVGCGYGKDKDDASWFGGKMSSTAFRE